MGKLDDTYTIIGIKHEAKKKEQKRTSQCVDDDINYIPLLRKSLLHKEGALQFFNCLTIGYQKNWARYVYSAKKEDTRCKRVQAMIHLLEQGKKSKDV